MKVFNKKYLYSWATRDNAQSYIGKLGFFANFIDRLALDTSNVYILDEINAGRATCFKAEDELHHVKEYAFFVPLDKVIDLDDCVKTPRCFSWLLPSLCQWAIEDRKRYIDMQLGAPDRLQEARKHIDTIEEFKRYLAGEYDEDIR